MRHAGFKLRLGLNASLCWHVHMWEINSLSIISKRQNSKSKLETIFDDKTTVQKIMQIRRPTLKIGRGGLQDRGANRSRVWTVNSMLSDRYRPTTARPESTSRQKSKVLLCGAFVKNCLSTGSRVILRGNVCARSWFVSYLVAFVSFAVWSTVTKVCCVDHGYFL